jgi:hypothetical protein
VCDLIAFLAAVDPEPLLHALGLELTDVRVRREVILPAAGRAYLLVYNHDAPIAIVEVKESAAEHGNQFSAYTRWAADSSGKPRRCFRPHWTTAWMTYLQGGHIWPFRTCSEPGSKARTRTPDGWELRRPGC